MRMLLEVTGICSCAREEGSSLVVPRNNVRTSIVAQVRLPISGSALEYNIDAMPINELLRLDPDIESRAAAMRRALAALRSKCGPRNVMLSAAKKN